MRSLIEIVLVMAVATIFSVKVVETRQMTSIKKLNKPLKNLHHNQKLNKRQIDYIKREVMLP